MAGQWPHSAQLPTLASIHFHLILQEMLPPASLLIDWDSYLICMTFVMLMKVKRHANEGVPYLERGSPEMSDAQTNTNPKSIESVAP